MSFYLEYTHNDTRVDNHRDNYPTYLSFTKTGDTTRSRCGYSESYLQIDYPARDQDNRSARIEFEIQHDTGQPMKIVKISVRDGIVTGKRFEFNGFETRYPDHAYGCDSKQTLNLTEQSWNLHSGTADFVPVQLVMSRVRIEARRHDKDAEFYQPLDVCDLDSPGGGFYLYFLYAAVAVLVVGLLAWISIPLARR